MLAVSVQDVSVVARRATLPCAASPAVSHVIESLTDAILPRTLELAAERLWQRLQCVGRASLLQQVTMLDAALGGEPRHGGGTAAADPRALVAAGARRARTPVGMRGSDEEILRSSKCLRTPRQFKYCRLPIRL